HSGNIQDRIKTLSNGGKNLPSATSHELDGILNAANDFYGHQMEDKAWYEIDQATALLKDNGIPDPSSSSGNGKDSSPGTLNPDHKNDDTATSSVDSSKGEANYQSGSEVTLHNYFNNDGIHTSNVKEATKVTLYPADAADSFVVTFDKDSNQFKITTT